ncbi:MAG: glycerol-3-phosphate 1-O-acyltransferase PlsY [Thiotrichaceae bacterium]
MPDEILPFIPYIIPCILVVFAYLLGSISSAILTCKTMGLPDPRTVGSNNPGATNVLRHGGKKAAAFTLIGDMFKGLVPVLIAKFSGLDTTWIMLVGLAAFLGHLYPIYFRLRGGKGVATAIGVYVGINWLAGLMMVVTWLFIAKGLKVSSLAALIATLLTPLYFHLLMHNQAITLGMCVITLLIFWRHRSNIKNILDGTENKIGPKD